MLNDDMKAHVSPKKATNLCDTKKQSKTSDMIRQNDFVFVWFDYSANAMRALHGTFDFQWLIT